MPIRAKRLVSRGGNHETNQGNGACARGAGSSIDPRVRRKTLAQRGVLPGRLEHVIHYWQTAVAGFKKAAAQYKVTAKVAGPDNYDPQAELTELKNAVAAKPAGILISVADATVLHPKSMRRSTPAFPSSPSTPTPRAAAGSTSSAPTILRRAAWAAAGLSRS